MMMHRLLYAVFHAEQLPVGQTSRPVEFKRCRFRCGVPFSDKHMGSFTERGGNPNSVFPAPGKAPHSAAVFYSQHHIRISIRNRIPSPRNVPQFPGRNLCTKPPWREPLGIQPSSWINPIIFCHTRYSSRELSPVNTRWVYLWITGFFRPLWITFGVRRGSRNLTVEYTAAAAIIGSYDHIIHV